MIFHMELIFQAMPCLEYTKYFKKNQELLMHLHNKYFIKLYKSCLWYQFQEEMLNKKQLQKSTCYFLDQDLNISNIFYKIKIKIKKKN